MTVELGDVRTALKMTLKNANIGLHCYDLVQDVTQTPAAVVEPASGDFAVSFNSGETYYFSLMILVANTDTANTQKILDHYVSGRGPKSVRQVINQNGDLGIGVSAFAENFKGYNGSPAVDGKKIGAVIRVKVTVT